jgi:hypothetical protein
MSVSPLIPLWIYRSENLQINIQSQYYTCIHTWPVPQTYIQNNSSASKFKNVYFKYLFFSMLSSAVRWTCSISMKQVNNMQYVRLRATPILNAQFSLWGPVSIWLYTSSLTQPFLKKSNFVGYFGNDCEPYWHAHPGRRQYFEKWCQANQKGHSRCRPIPHWFWCGNNGEYIASLFRRLIFFA